MLSNVSINVTVNGDGTFTASSSLGHLETPAASFEASANGLVTKIVAEHEALSGVPDSLLTGSGIELRDTPLG